MGAFLGLSLLFLGFAAVSGLVEGFAVESSGGEAADGLLFWASASLSLALEPLSFLSHGAVGGQVWC